MGGLSASDAGALQRTIDRLTESLRHAGGQMDAHDDVSTYRVICDSHGLWRDPAFGPAILDTGEDHFWLGFRNYRDQLVGLVAGKAIDTEDIHQFIEAGRLWRQGGFGSQASGLAEQPILKVDATRPTRDLSGRISYLQFHVLERGQNLTELSWMMSWLSQAIAFRQHQSQFAISLVRHGLEKERSVGIRKSFARSEFCLSGYIPPMEAATTLYLCHTSLEEYLSWGQQLEFAPGAVRSVSEREDLIQRAVA